MKIVNNSKISIWNFAVIFVALFPIMPSYFKVFSLEAGTILCIILLVAFILMSTGKIHLCHIDMVDICIIIWAIIRSAQYLISGQLTGAINIFFRTLVAGGIIVYCIDSKKRFLSAINAIVYTGGIVAIFGLVESLTKFNIFSLLNTVGETLNYNPLRFGLLRIISYSSHAIVYCCYIIFILALTFYSINVSKNKKAIWIKKVIYILLIVNGLLTLSRSSIIALIASQVLLLYFCGFKEFLKKLLIVCIGTIVAIALLSLISETAAKFIKNMLYMVLAVFDSDYKTLIADNFGTDNLNATGNRLDLYKWVWSNIQGNLLLGRGSNAKFSHFFTQFSGRYFFTVEKTSIEVQYLNVLFHFGFLGLITEVIANLALLLRTFRNYKSKSTWENNIGFCAVGVTIFIVYFSLMFAVNQSSDAKIFYVFCMLVLAYCKHKGFETSDIKSNYGRTL